MKRVSSAVPGVNNVHLVKNSSTKTMPKPTNLQKFILVMLSHAKRSQNVTRDEILRRVFDFFICRCVVISKDKDQSEGYNYHIGS